MRSVVDASFILDFLLPDEQSANVIKTFEKYKKGQITLIAPILLPVEVANGLKYAVKAKRIKQEIAFELLETFLKFEIDFIDFIEIETDLQKVLTVALNEDLSIYDASYIYLSQNLNIPLLTLDKTLKKLSSQEH